MRFLKLALISAVLIFLLITGISLLLPSQTIISRAIDINASADSVYPYISNLANWRYWYADYNSANAVISPSHAGKTSVLALNKTKVFITHLLPGKVQVVWQTGENNPVSGEFNIIRKDPARSTTVQWQFTQKVSWYPWQKFASIMTGKIIGPSMEKSLENLKMQAEAEALKKPN